LLNWIDRYIKCDSPIKKGGNKFSNLCKKFYLINIFWKKQIKIFLVNIGIPVYHSRARQQEMLSDFMQKLLFSSLSEPRGRILVWRGSSRTWSSSPATN
jgi:hypothetical protein